MARKFTEHVVLGNNPDFSGIAVFAPGDDLPEWAEDMVGDHCLTPEEDEDGNELTGAAAYAEMTKAELKGIIEARNAEREEDDHLSASGNKSELVERLVEDDESENEDGDENNSEE